MDFNHLVDAFQMPCDKYAAAKQSDSKALWSWKRVFPGHLSLKKQVVKKAEMYVRRPSLPSPGLT